MQQKLNLRSVLSLDKSYKKFQVNISKDNKEKSGKRNFSKGQ